MRRMQFGVFVVVVILGVCGMARGDGGYFVTAEDLVGTDGFAQVGQDVIMAFYDAVAVAGDCTAASWVCTESSYRGYLAANSPCGGDAGIAEAWYWYTPSESGDVVVSVHDDTGGQLYDVSVFDICPECGDMPLVHSAGLDSSSPFWVDAEFEAEADTPYAIRVSGVAGQAAMFDLTVSGPEAMPGCIPFETEPEVTYVLRSRYHAAPDSFAWVIPVPAVPTDIKQHPSDEVFELLRQTTSPQVSVMKWVGGGCACGSVGTAHEVYGLDPIEIEAQGEAGIFTWTVLRSTGSDALLNWLDSNGFRVSDGDAAVLAPYIEDERHFLAVRIADDAALVRDADDQVEVPPLQFTCRTAERFYPMAISRISAAASTTVLMYVLADHRAEVANAANEIIKRSELHIDDSTASGTNYLELFQAALDRHVGAALITEYAGSRPYGSSWSDATTLLSTEARTLTYLTRMRTELQPEQMDIDFELVDSPTDEEVSPEFFLYESTSTAGVIVVLQPFALLALYGFCRHRRR